MAFATVADLEQRLGRSLSTQTGQVQLLLEDATAYLRSVLGGQISPPSTVTVRTLAERGAWIRPPAYPASVVSVAVNGVPVVLDPFAVADAVFACPGCWFGSEQRLAVDVTYALGYTETPPDLVSWTCVLASQMLSALADTGSLSGSGVTSVSIDDFRKGWASDAAASVLPVPVLDRLRAAYGTAVFVTESR